MESTKVGGQLDVRGIEVGLGAPTTGAQGLPVAESTPSVPDLEREKLKLWTAARGMAAKTEVDEFNAEEVTGTVGEISEATRGLGKAAWEQAVLESNLAVKEKVAEENGYAKTETGVGERVIGGDSELLRNERLAKDRESYDNDVATGSLKRRRDALTGQTVKELRGEMKALEDHPADLQSFWYRKMTQFLRENENRVIGERN